MEVFSWYLSLLRDSGKFSFKSWTLKITPGGYQESCPGHHQIPATFWYQVGTAQHRQGSTDHPWLRRTPEKYVNIPSEKYIYVHKYVYICVYTYLCKMDEHRSYAGLSEKWMQSCLTPSCHKNGCSPVSYNLTIKMNAVLSHAILP